MLLDMETCGGTLQGSGGSSNCGCCSLGFSVCSVLLGWVGDKDWAEEWLSDTGGATGGVSSDTLASSEIQNWIMTTYLVFWSKKTRPLHFY